VAYASSMESIRLAEQNEFRITVRGVGIEIVVKLSLRTIRTIQSYLCIINMN